MTRTAIERDPSRQQHREERRTNYELFAATDGALQITEFYDLAPPRVKYGHCTANVIHACDAQSGSNSIALRIEHKNSDGYRFLSFLDADEVISLSAALKHVIDNYDRIVQGAKTYTEVTYKSRGGFSAGIYVNPKRDVGVYIEVGGESVFFHSLHELIRLVDDALFRIDTLQSRPASI